jgi:hypothetical protein
VAPVTSILAQAAGGQNFGTATYMRPSVVLNPRTFQLGAVVRF